MTMRERLLEAGDPEIPEHERIDEDMHHHMKRVALSLFKAGNILVIPIYNFIFLSPCFE